MKMLLSSNAVGAGAQAAVLMNRGFSLVVGSSWISPAKAGEPSW